VRPNRFDGLLAVIHCIDDAYVIARGQQVFEALPRQQFIVDDKDL
jgi:hypothetical protein